MGTFFYCSNCGKKVKLKYTSREEVPYLLITVCPYCGELNVLTPKDVEEERVCRFKCPVCGTTLYFEYSKNKEVVRCPVCGTVFEVSTKKCTPKVLEYGTLSPKYTLYWNAVLLGYLRGKSKTELVKYLLPAELIRPRSARAEKAS